MSGGRGYCGSHHKAQGSLLRLEPPPRQEHLVASLGGVHQQQKRCPKRQRSKAVRKEQSFLVLASHQHDQLAGTRLRLLTGRRGGKLSTHVHGYVGELVGELISGVLTPIFHWAQTSAVGPITRN